MKKLLVSAAVVATLSLGACSSTGMSKDSGAADYASTIAEAKAIHAKSKAQGNVWKQKKMKKAYVDHYIAKSEAAAKKGDDAAAMKYAKEALHTAKAEELQNKRYADLKPAWVK